MTKHLIALTAACGLLAGAGTGALAQNSNAPGIQMQEKGSVSGTTGASGYSPGHKLQTDGSVKGTTGASGYAPGQVDTGTSVDTDADVKAGGAKIRGGADAKVKIK
jgi:hypothetical protein